MIIGSPSVQSDGPSAAHGAACHFGSYRLRRRSGSWLEAYARRITKGLFRIIISAIRKPGLFAAMCALASLRVQRDAVSSDNDAFAVGLTCGGILDPSWRKCHSRLPELAGRSRHGRIDTRTVICC